MPAELTFASALLVGLFGSVHCAGMCGGIAGALGMGAPAAARASPAGLLPILLGYNAGRIASYTAAGAAAGFAGAASASLFPVHVAQIAGMTLAAAFLLALGLYLAGWTQVLAPLERAGARLWRHVQPLGRRCLPVRGPGRAMALGLVWGWLPCGLVYSALVWSLTAGSAARGALLMLGFGLGTLPMLLGLGAAGPRLARLGARAGVRRAAGILLIAAGVYGLMGAYHHAAATNAAARHGSSASAAAHGNDTARSSPAPAPEALRGA